MLDEPTSAIVTRRWILAAWVGAAIFAVAGVFGRSLWKADEPYSFGIVWEMLQDHHWVVPYIAGQPFVEKPPLVYWVAAGFARALPYWAPDESARLAVLLFGTVGLSALVVALWRLRCEAFAWARFVARVRSVRFGSAFDVDATVYATTGVLVAMGTVGFVEHVHKLTADIGQLAGATVGLCGLVLIATQRDDPATDVRAARRGAVTSGMVLGTGAGVAFLSKGLFVPATLLTTSVLSLALPAFRTRAARLAFVVALMAALPWLLWWPAALYTASPQLFREWLWDNNIGRFVGFTLLGGNGRSLADKTASLLLAGFPTTLLLAGAVACSWRCTARMRWRARWRMVERAPAHATLMLYLVVTTTALTCSASMRDVYILPLLPAMVMLGLPLVLLPLPFSIAGRRVATGLFAAAAVACVALWLILVARGTLIGVPGMKQIVGATLPLANPLPMRAGAIAVALVALAAWSIVVARDPMRSAAVAWSAGFAATWSLAAALLLPWIDAAHDYRTVFAQIAPQLARSRTCVGSLNLGESELSMLEYVTGVEATRAYLGHSGSGAAGGRNPAVDACDWLVAMSNGRVHASLPNQRRWRPVVTVGRSANRDERITVYRSVDGEAAAEPSR
jgi:4-amino-4-deoxy-L-arabinose transferase-like glycosyltransferase